VDPVIRDGEVAAYALGGFQQTESPLDLVDHSVSLVDADRKSQVPKLGSQHALLASCKRPQFQMLWHPVLLEGQDSTY
jgi:hypothetical protein